MITDRVTAKSIDGDEFIRENFDKSSDADLFFEQLQSNGGDIDAMLSVYPIIIITHEEMHIGEWIVKSRKMVRR